MLLGGCDHQFLVVTTLEQLFCSFCPGSGRFWKMRDVRPQEIATFALDGQAGLVQEKNVISWCIIWGPGLARKPFTDCYSTRAVHNL